MTGFGHFKRNFASKQVRNQRAITESRQPVGNAFDLCVYAPPLLNDDDAGRLVSRSRLGVIPRTILSVRPFETDHLTHENPPLALHADCFCASPSNLSEGILMSMWFGHRRFYELISARQTPGDPIEVKSHG